MRAECTVGGRRVDAAAGDREIRAISTLKRLTRQVLWFAREWRVNVVTGDKSI
jgi:hypothetical protein